MNIYKVISAKQCEKYDGILNKCSNYFILANFISGITPSFISPIFEYDNYVVLGGLTLWLTLKLSLLHISKNINYDNELKKFNLIYSNIVKKFIELSKSINFNDPLEIFMLFKYLYKNNKFSLTQEHQCIDSIDYDIKLIKELTLNNHGVCRHVSAMLTDIYNQISLESSVGSCLLKVNSHIIDFDDNLPQDDDKNATYNHCITLVNDKNYTYFLDAETGIVLRQNKITKTLTDGDIIEISMNNERTKILNEWFGFRDINIKPSPEWKYLFEKEMQIIPKIKENTELIEEFASSITEELIEAENIYKLIMK